MGKKSLLLLIALLLNVTCFTGVLFVSAYLVSNDRIVNSATVGNAKLKILEEFESPQELEPGQVIPKKVQIKNTGLSPCDVRVMVVFSSSRAQKHARIEYNTGDWEWREDGYWYYKKTLKPGGITECLFENVTITEGVPKEELKGFEIIVYSECVNEGSEGFR